MKQSEDIKADDRHIITVSEDGKYHKLVIKQATYSDKGTYVFSASNRAGKQLTKSEVTIIYAPKLINHLKDLEVVQKKNALLEIEIDAIPTPILYWYKNGVLIDFTAPEYEGRYSLIDRKGGVYHLSIKNVKPEDTAHYKCVVSNKCGEV